MDFETINRIAGKIARRLNISFAHAKVLAEIHYVGRPAR